ncbi:MAG: hypothetical protein AVDCRST_MAG65-2128 [uncultured Solirubrobacteraceae bacterium]|uniref:Uncharacterized protein n=1 Tax=uncultured Solirubrobacteraceae bacterium TaxID=1162706 RepID=A0A6J4SFT3_9ACTN|nr:MAG: hypothetical protein AVDCRST_MAG65-2128 [uncultured Solirubrobacteraceae bacterium]
MDAPRMAPITHAESRCAPSGSHRYPVPTMSRLLTAVVVLGVPALMDRGVRVTPTVVHAQPNGAIPDDVAGPQRHRRP